MLSYFYCFFILSIITGSTLIYSYEADPNRNQQKRAVKSFKWVYLLTLPLLLLFSIAPLFWHHTILLQVHQYQPLQLLGVIAATGGFLLFAFSKKELGKNYSPCYSALIPQELVTSGPYQYIRHPLYTANLLILFGFFLIGGSLWVLINTLVLAIYYNRSTQLEEESLSEEFANYQDYAANTGRIFPRLVK